MSRRATVQQDALKQVCFFATEYHRMVTSIRKDIPKEQFKGFYGNLLLVSSQICGGVNMVLSKCDLEEGKLKETMDMMFAQQKALNEFVNERADQLFKEETHEPTTQASPAPSHEAAHSASAG